MQRDVAGHESPANCNPANRAEGACLLGGSSHNDAKSL
jgi:hypothetical protein